MDLTFGARLRAHREQQRISLAEISASTKISVTLLEGLERDEVSRWPGGVFRRAYIRAYAQAIGLDAEMLLHEFLAKYPDPTDGGPLDALAQAAEQGVRGKPRMRLGFLLDSIRAFRSETERNTDSRAAVPPVDHVATHASAPPAEITPPASTPTDILRPPVQPSQRQPRRRNPTHSREPRAIEHTIRDVARLCGTLSCVQDGDALRMTLPEIARVVDAQAVAVWLWDRQHAVLRPVLVQGYSEQLTAKLPSVSRNDNNAIAATFRSAQLQVVKGNAKVSGAVVTPVVTPHGCAGVLALEFRNGGEQRQLVRGFAAIISAQLAALVTGAPEASTLETSAPPRPAHLAICVDNSRAPASRAPASVNELAHDDEDALQQQVGRGLCRSI
jgi:transcriptional regulator with XRE-family HTH domain